MDPCCVAVHCYWNGTRVKKVQRDVVYEGPNVKVKPMKLSHGISYGGLLDRLYAITGIDRNKLELNIICRYPISSQEYKPIPVKDDEDVQHMLEVPSRCSVYCVEIYLEKEAVMGRKWKELKMDCLVNVFQKVGLESLLLNVPLVCKLWYEASLEPMCWKNLIFRKDLQIESYAGSFNKRLISKVRFGTVHRMIKFAIDRSNGCATTLELPHGYTTETLVYAANKCPSLKFLALPGGTFWNDVNPKLISKFKNLEMLEILNINNTKEIIAEISVHCNNFTKLSAPGLQVSEKEASSIVTFLPKIRYLVLRKARFNKRENLVMILNGCKELVHLDVAGSIGFSENDGEILELASHIPEFSCQGSISS